MPAHCVMITLLVHDYDHARDWFVEKLGFCIATDDLLNETNKDGTAKRWLSIKAPNDHLRLLLAQASSDEERAAVGHQAGGRVMGFFETDNFKHDFHHWKNAGVEFLEAPRQELYGTVAVFIDICGNKWDLIEPA